jgi:hypothetical protein
MPKKLNQDADVKFDNLTEEQLKAQALKDFGVNESELETHKEPIFQSFKEIGSWIAGLFQGIDVQLTNDGNILHVAYFLQKDGQLKSCIAGFKFMEFLKETQFQENNFLYVEKVGETPVKDSKKQAMSIFKFLYNKKALTFKKIQLKTTKELANETIPALKEVKKIES